MDILKIAQAMVILATAFPQLKADFDELIEGLGSTDRDALRAQYDAAMVDAGAAHRDAQGV